MAPPLCDAPMRVNTSIVNTSATFCSLVNNRPLVMMHVSARHYIQNSGKGGTYRVFLMLDYTKRAFRRHSVLA